MPESRPPTAAPTRTNRPPPTLTPGAPPGPAGPRGRTARPSSRHGLPLARSHPMPPFRRWRRRRPAPDLRPRMRRTGFAARCPTRRARAEQDARRRADRRRTRAGTATGGESAGRATGTGRMAGPRAPGRPRARGDPAGPPTLAGTQARRRPRGRRPCRRHQSPRHQSPRHPARGHQSRRHQGRRTGAHRRIAAPKVDHTQRRARRPVSVRGAPAPRVTSRTGRVPSTPDTRRTGRFPARGNR